MTNFFGRKSVPKNTLYSIFQKNPKVSEKSSNMTLSKSNKNNIITLSKSKNNNMKHSKPSKNNMMTLSKPSKNNMTLSKSNNNKTICNKKSSNENISTIIDDRQKNILLCRKKFKNMFVLNQFSTFNNYFSKLSEISKNNNLFKHKFNMLCYSIFRYSVLLDNSNNTFEFCDYRSSKKNLKLCYRLFSDSDDKNYSYKYDYKLLSSYLEFLFNHYFNNSNTLFKKNIKNIFYKIFRYYSILHKINKNCNYKLKSKNNKSKNNTSNLTLSK